MMGAWRLPNEALHSIVPYLKDSQDDPYIHEIRPNNTNSSGLNSLSMCLNIE